MGGEEPERKLQRILAEYAMARVEHHLACQVLANRPRTVPYLESAESRSELRAREKLLFVRDQLRELHAAPCRAAAPLANEDHVVIDQAAKSESIDLLHNYEAAILDFNAASANLILHLANQSIPSDAHVTMEEQARAEVVQARRKLWARYLAG